MNINHSIRLDIYINYPVNCEQAFRFYEPQAYYFLPWRIFGLNYVHRKDATV